MQYKDNDEEIIKNFITTMDMNLDLETQLNNVIRDSNLYDLSVDLTAKLVNEIIQEYKIKENK